MEIFGELKDVSTLAPTLKIQSSPNVTYYVGDGQKVRYFVVYDTLGSKFGSFLIVGPKMMYVTLVVRYFGGRLY
jgi:hypothetical protein